MILSELIWMHTYKDVCFCLNGTMTEVAVLFQAPHHHHRPKVLKRVPKNEMAKCCRARCVRCEKMRGPLYRNIVCFMNIGATVLSMEDTVAEWLRRSTRNRLGLSRVGSSPASVDLFFCICSACRSVDDFCCMWCDVDSTPLLLFGRVSYLLLALFGRVASLVEHDYAVLEPCCDCEWWRWGQDNITAHSSANKHPNNKMMQGIRIRSALGPLI